MKGGFCFFAKNVAKQMYGAQAIPRYSPWRKAQWL